MAPTPQNELARHQQNVERLARLEEKAGRAIEDISSLREEIKPISQAFERAKGIKAAVMFLGILIAGTIGALAKEIISWLLSALGKH